MIQKFKEHFNFTVLWSAFVVISAVIGFSLGIFLVRDIDDHYYFALSVFLFIFVLSFSVGVGQWLALFINLRNFWIWIPLTAIGYSVGSFVFLFILASLGSTFLDYDELYFGAYPWILMTVTLLLTGMFTGCLQWIALGKKLKTSITWSVVSGVSLVIGFLYPFSPVAAYQEPTPFLLVVCVLVYAVITGVFASSLIVSVKT